MTVKGYSRSHYCVCLSPCVAKTLIIIGGQGSYNKDNLHDPKPVDKNNDYHFILMVVNHLWHCTYCEDNIRKTKRTLVQLLRLVHVFCCPTC